MTDKIVFLGLPGAGKGTQGKLLSKYLEIPHFSCGDRIRQLIKTKSLLGLEIKKFLESNGDCWQPLPDDLAFAVASLAPNKCVLDGFPRNASQLSWFAGNNIFLHLNISDAESKKRVLARNRCDDALINWESRISCDRSRLPQLLKACCPINIDAEGKILDIFEEVKKCVINLK